MEQLNIQGVKFSYAYIFQRMKERDANKTGKYQVDILWPKNNQELTTYVWNAVQTLVNQAQQDPGAAGAIQRGQFHMNIIKDGDKMKFGKNDQSTYAGYYYITAKSDEPVQVIDQFGREITSDAGFFSGCTGNAGVGLKLYSPQKDTPVAGYGITVKLLALQRTGGSEADRLGGAPKVEATQFFNVQPAPMQGFGAPQQPANVYGQPQQFGQPTPPYGQAAPQNIQTGFAGNPGQYQQPASQPYQSVPGQIPGYSQQPPQQGFGVAGPGASATQGAPATQNVPGFGAPAPQSNPFPQTGLPQQPVAPQQGFQTGQAPQFPPAQPQVQPGPHQTTPAFGVPQGFDPYAQPGQAPGQLPY